ncbi:unnamed protein product, partial [Prorocentrum cordatum]
VLLDVTIDVLKGDPVPLDFNDSLIISNPKGSEPDDGHAAASLATATWPLSLKSTECKVVASMGNYLLKLLVAQGAHGAQKRFLPKRRSIEHVVAMDAQSRIGAMQDEVRSKGPLLVLFVFGDAFRSMCRAWLNM